MKVYAIDHVQLAMPPHQEEQARAFYCEVLGLVETPKPSNLVQPRVSHDRVSTAIGCSVEGRVSCFNPVMISAYVY